MNKINILEQYAKFKDLLIPEPIYQELITVRTSIDYRSFKKITATAEFVMNNSGNKHSEGLKYPDTTLIQAYETSRAHGILTDDGMICKYCKHHNIPFINTPMAVFSLKVSNIIGLDEFYEKLDNVYQIGRYSDFVTDYMKEMIRIYIINV